MANDDTRLRLEELVEEYIPGVTESQAKHHIEACLVCFDHHQHQSGIEMFVKEKVDNIFQLDWKSIIDDQIRRSWRDLEEATEYGAIGVAVLVIIKTTEFTISERSVKGTGFDYWLAEKDKYNEDELLFKNSARLEVSGILNAKNDKDIRNRVNQKVKQTQASDNMKLPALIVVVEFGRPEVHVVRKL